MFSTKSIIFGIQFSSLLAQNRAPWRIGTSELPICHKIYHLQGENHHFILKNHQFLYKRTVQRAVVLQNSSFFNAKFLVLNTKFIIFTHSMAGPAGHLVKIITFQGKNPHFLLKNLHFYRRITSG